MLPTTDRAILALRRVIGDKPDDAVCLVEAGVLRAALMDMLDHQECATIDADDQQ